MSIPLSIITKVLGTEACTGITLMHKKTAMIAVNFFIFLLSVVVFDAPLEGFEPTTQALEEPRSFP